MAISYTARYAGQIDPASGEYPQGTPRNDATPGDQSGTPWEEAILKDIAGFQAALLLESGIAASDIPDTALISQYLDGIKATILNAAQMTTLDLIASTKVHAAGAMLLLGGYSSAGGIGQASWVLTGVTGLPVSQSPAQLGDALIVDGNGDQWAIVQDGKISTAALGTTGLGLVDELAILNACYAGLDEPHLPEGSYQTSAVWEMFDDNKTVTGAGQGKTIIVPAFVSGDVIKVGDGITDIKNVFLRDFTIDAPSGFPRTAGAGIRLDDAQQCEFSRIELLDQFRGIQIDGANTTHVVFKNIVIRNVVPSTGTGVFINGGGDHFFSYLSINNPDGSQPLAGIEIRNSNATWFDNSDIIHSGIGLLVNPGAGDIVTWIFAMNTAFDLNDNDGIRIKSSNAGAINKGHQFTGCWTSSNDSVGVRIGGADVPDGIYFSNHRSFTNGSNGYLLEAGKNVNFDACKAGGNSVTTPGTSAGFQINANVNDFAVRNCTSGLQARFTNLQGRGLTINAGTSDNYIVTGNDFTNNTLGPLDGGTGVNKVFTNNIS